MDASAVKPEAHAKNNKSPDASDQLPAGAIAVTYSLGAYLLARGS